MISKAQLNRKGGGGWYTLRFGTTDQMKMFIAIVYNSYNQSDCLRSVGR